MEGLRIMTLDLRAPLSEEGITEYPLPPTQAAVPDPTPEGYLQESSAIHGATAEIGKYLFLQVPGTLEEGSLLEYGIELQKEGLWRALYLDPKLFVRVLTEEGRTVTQLLRPIRG